MSKSLKIILIFFTLSLAVVSFAQPFQSSVKSICLVNYRNGRVKFINTRRKVKITLKEYMETRKGRITSVNDSLIFINNIPYKIHDIAVISPRQTGLVIARMGGGAVSAMGAGLIVTGFVWLSEAKNDNSGGWGGMFLDLAAFGAIATGVLTVPIGAIPLMIHQRRYYLDRDWKLKIVDYKPKY